MIGENTDKYSAADSPGALTGPAPIWGERGGRDGEDGGESCSFEASGDTEWPLPAEFELTPVFVSMTLFPWVAVSLRSSVLEFFPVSSPVVAAAAVFSTYESASLLAAIVTAPNGDL